MNAPAGRAEPSTAPTWLLGAALALSSSAAMALEIAAARLLAPYVGMSLYSWTAVIAVVLAGLSLGHWIGGALSDQGAARRLEARLGLLLLAAAATTFLSQFLVRLLAGAVTPALSPVGAIGVLAFVAFFAPSFFAGAHSPLLTKLALDAAPAARHGRVLGRMYALGAVGAVLGTVGGGLALIPYLGVAVSIGLLAALYAALAALFLTRRWRLGAVGAAILAAVSVGAAGDALSPCDEESGYFCIRVDDLSGSRAARVLALDHLAHSVNDRDDPRWLHSPYVQLVDELARRRFAGPALDAFFIGGGAYTLPRAWAASYPEARLLVAEIDSDVTAVARRDLWFEPDARIAIVHQDARATLAALPPERRFDIVFGDAFHDISIPTHLATDEFHQQIAARLKPGGFYALNVVEVIRRPRFLASIAETLQRRFAFVELWLWRESLSPRERRATWVVIASDAPSGAEALASSYGPANRWARAPTQEMIDLFMPDERVFLTDDFAPVNRLMSHLLLDADLAQ